MNKYSSGYALIKILQIFGSLIVGISILGGLIGFFAADKGMGWVALVVAVSGGFQGILLMGAAAIGEAVLDGARHLADCATSLRAIEGSTRIDKDHSSSKVTPSPDYSKVKPMRNFPEEASTDSRIR